MRKANQFSKMMRDYEKSQRKQEERSREEEEEAKKRAEVSPEPGVPLGLTTKLVFFKQYNTYQALLAVYPKGELSVDGAFSKVVLYIMRWFRNRLGEEAFEIYPDISFLREDYPQPEDYAGFDISQVSNINGLDFISFETAYLPDRKAWIVSLIEPDNGTENKGIQSRTFTTEISVYRQEDAVVLGIREGCREPRTNTEDAKGFRPGFVRDIFFDDELAMGEYGADREYDFDTKPHKLNGKSGEACRKLYDGLVGCRFRQMSVLFVPGEYYDKNSEAIDKVTVSLLGYCHIIVWENSCRKLFDQVMKEQELLEVAEENQLIFYRANNRISSASDYYEPDTEGLMSELKERAKKEPLRKYVDFGEFSFKPSWWENLLVSPGSDPEEVADLKNHYEAEIAGLTRKINDLERDNASLQTDNNSLQADNKKCENIIAKDASALSRLGDKLDEAAAERDKLKSDLQKANALLMQQGLQMKGMVSDEKERYRPLLNLPPLGMDRKKEILDWIREYYPDVLEVHPAAEKSFCDDGRNLDWHRFCMMIHYLAGYTRHRNEGGMALDSGAARNYDPEGSAYTVERTTSGQGTLDMYKDKYSITICEDGILKTVIMDWHIKYGKGRDVNMIRIYFYYSQKMKKSIIGYMPDHLPIRSNPH